MSDAGRDRMSAGGPSASCWLMSSVSSGRGGSPSTPPSWGLERVSQGGMLEPAGYGVATCFGPHTTNFRDIVGLLLGRRAAVVAHDEVELEAFLARCVREPEFLHELGQRAR